MSEVLLCGPDDEEMRPDLFPCIVNAWMPGRLDDPDLALTWHTMGTWVLTGDTSWLP